MKQLTRVRFQAITEQLDAQYLTQFLRAFEKLLAEKAECSVTIENYGYTPREAWEK